MALLLIAGVYFTYKSGFYRPSVIGKSIKEMVFSLKTKPREGISPFSAVATALGGTVGVGSIVGVGYAIAIGGAGSIFWMWICSFFGMGLKYAEVKTALKKRAVINGKPLGGAHVRLYGEGMKTTSVLFCVFCIMASFGTGNLTQVGSISSFLTSVGIGKMFCALSCVTAISVSVFGGRKRIASINTYLVPISSAIYITACLAILLINRFSIPLAFGKIFSEAFGISPFAGGVSGALIAKSLREGFARSLFSNEAGMGSSPLAHASAESENLEIQASWGVFEIFFDTFVVSTLTAVCLLSCGMDEPSQMFSVCFGSFGKYLFGLLLAVFAFASVLSWCYYAECCLSFLFPKNRLVLTVYRLAFSFSAVLGIYLANDIIWDVADIFNALMMFPNLVLLFKCRNEIERMK